MFNFQMSKLDIKSINEKLEEVFNKLDSAAKLISLLDLFFLISNSRVSVLLRTRKQ